MTLFSHACDVALCKGLSTLRCRENAESSGCVALVGAIQKWRQALTLLALACSATVVGHGPGTGTATSFSRRASSLAPCFSICSASWRRSSLRRAARGRGGETEYGNVGGRREGITGKVARVTLTRAGQVAAMLSPSGPSCLPVRYCFNTGYQLGGRPRAACLRRGRSCGDPRVHQRPHARWRRLGPVVSSGFG